LSIPCHQPRATDRENMIVGKRKRQSCICMKGESYDSLSSTCVRIPLRQAVRTPVQSLCVVHGHVHQKPREGVKTTSCCAARSWCTTAAGQTRPPPHMVRVYMGAPPLDTPLPAAHRPSSVSLMHSALHLCMWTGSTRASCPSTRWPPAAMRAFASTPIPPPLSLPLAACR
jgi:hypothetical protein